MIVTRNLEIPLVTAQVGSSQYTSAFVFATLTGKRIGILTEFNYEDMELGYPFYRLKEEGHEIFTIGPEKGKTYNSKNGYPCKAEQGIDEVTAGDLDALINPEVFTPDYWRRDKRILAKVKAMDDAGKVLASVCHGPWVLISAKVFSGRKVTCFEAIKDDVENAGANYSDVSVMIDKKASQGLARFLQSNHIFSKVNLQGLYHATILYRDLETTNKPANSYCGLNCTEDSYSVSAVFEGV